MLTPQLLSLFLASRSTLLQEVPQHTHAGWELWGGGRTLNHLRAWQHKAGACCLLLSPKRRSMDDNDVLQGNKGAHMMWAETKAHSISGPGSFQKHDSNNSLRGFPGNPRV